MNTKVRDVILGLLSPLIISILIKLIRISTKIYFSYNYIYFSNLDRYLFVIEIIIKTLIILGLYKFVKLSKSFSRYLIFGLVGMLLADLYILIKQFS